MRRILGAIAEELQRLKDEGVKTLAVSEESLAALRAAVKQQTIGKVERTARRGEAERRRVPETLQAPSPPQRGWSGSPRDASSTPDAASPAPPAPPAEPPSPPKLYPPPPVVSLSPGDKAARWAALKEMVLGDETCRAHVRPGKKVVLGVGNLDARIMFVGEAPGAEEEVQGEPFVGAAGQLLNRMIAGAGLARSDVYIGNIMNWRPEMPVGPGGVQMGNRPPTAEEMAYCLPYLRAQIEVVNPELLVALGATAAQGLLGAGTFKTLGELRGRWRDFQGKPLLVTYHPSYILRNPTNRSKRAIWEDFLRLMERAALPISDKQRGYFLDR